MYTEGKWLNENGLVFIKPGKPAIANCSNEYQPKYGLIPNSKIAIDNACHICECVNGYDELKAQRDELLEACKLAFDLHYPDSEDKPGLELSPIDKKCREMLEAAIAKTKVDLH